MAEQSERMAGEGLRILALAMKEVSHRDAEPYSNLTLLGLACFLDPPREEVQDAIAAAHTAGIRTIMITGDQVATAPFHCRTPVHVRQCGGSYGR